MSDEFSAAEKFVEEFLIDLMVEKVIFVEAQDSSKRGVKTSLSTTRGSRPSQPTTEKRTKKTS
jgi:hypothetical protein